MICREKKKKNQKKIAFLALQIEFSFSYACEQNIFKGKIANQKWDVSISHISYSLNLPIPPCLSSLAKKIK